VGYFVDWVILWSVLSVLLLVAWWCRPDRPGRPKDR
jgi:hypothetical protein